MDLNLQNGIEYQGIEELGNTNIIQDYNIPGPSRHVTQVIPSRIPPLTIQHPPAVQPKKKVKKFRDEESRRKWEDMMTSKRRKLFTNIIKKEIGKQHRSKINRHKEMLLQCKRIASHCAKHARQKAVSKTILQSQVSTFTSLFHFHIIQFHTHLTHYEHWCQEFL